jgi:arylsulfatase A-like enzyme
VFTSDNGAVYPLSGFDPEYFRSNGGLRGYKGGMYEGGIRVPLIVRWKGQIAAGTTSPRVTGFEDWFPTLLELAGMAATPAARLDGMSFVPTLLGRKQAARPPLYRESPGYGGQQMVRAGDWKLVRTGLISTPKKPTVPATELFNLAKDPGETTDVAARHPKIVAKLERILREQRTPSVGFPFASLDADRASRDAGVKSPASLKPATRP